MKLNFTLKAKVWKWPARNAFGITEAGGPGDSPWHFVWPVIWDFYDCAIFQKTQKRVE
jgi:hypothetical protein